MRILIGSPSTDGEVEPSFAEAVLSLVGSFMAARRTVTFDMEMPIGRSVVRARDVLANRVLADESISHLLFLDTDMGFRPELIGRMLDVDKPVVGTIAPQRHRDLDEFRGMAAAVGNAALAEVCSASYTPDVSALALDGVDLTDPAATAGFIPAHQTGAGILLIRRDVLETMALLCPELSETAVRPEMAAIGLDRPLVRFFRPDRGPEGVLLGEDISFTRRWTERCLGEIWLVPDGIITHTGTRVVTGHYQRRLALLGTA